MPIPNVTLNILDGALGINAPSAAGICVKIGTCSTGTPNTVYSFGDATTAKTMLGDGPLTEAVCYALENGGQPVLAIPTTVSTAGSAGSVTHSGTGTAVVVASGTPHDVYSVIAKIIKPAANLAAAAATYSLSLDGGISYGPETAVPTGGTITDATDGLTLTITDGTFVAGDTYAFATVAPLSNLTNLSAAINALIASGQPWSLVHVVGPASTVSGAATIAAGVDSLMASAAAQYQYGRAVIELPIDTDTNINAAFASFASVRVGVAAGTEKLFSGLTGRYYTRSSAWPAMARIAATDPATDPAEVDLGPLKGILSLDRDERATPGLDSTRFITLRTIVGTKGFFVTDGNLMAPSGSDFKYIQYGRVMDLACSIAVQALTRFLSGKFFVDPTTGFINGKDATSIELFITGKLNAALLSTSQASAVSVAVNRSNNFLSSQSIFVSVRVVPLGYAKQIVTDIGFSNPALTKAAA